MVQQTRQALPHPGRTGPLRLLRIRAEGFLPGALHALHTWRMAILYLVFPDTSGQPERVFPALERLYRQTARDMRRTLVGWLNPWIPTPKCAAAVMNITSCYKEDRHQVWIHKKDQYLLQLLDCYTGALDALLSLPESSGNQAPSWGQVLAPMQERVAGLKRVYGTLEQHPYLQAVQQEWAPLERALLEAGRRWESRPDIDEVRQYYQVVSALQQALWKRMRILLTHELTHAWTRRKKRRARDIWYTQSGVQRFDREYMLAHRARPGRLFLHWALDEAIVEWIALRTCQDDPLLTWGRVALLAGYAYWLTNDIVEALNAYWERVSAAVPALSRRCIRNPEELLYTIHFRDPDASSWFEQSLAVACGDLQAFALLSQACERFTLGSGGKTLGEGEALKASFADLRRLLAPALPASERQIPFPFWGELVAELPQQTYRPLMDGALSPERIALPY